MDPVEGFTTRMRIATYGGVILIPGHFVAYLEVHRSGNAQK